MEDNNKEEIKGKKRDRKAIIWRVLNSIMGLFFVVATFLQINDPDPAIWMCLYGVTAVITFSIAIHPLLQEKLLWKIIVGLHFACTVAMFCYIILYYGHVIKENTNILHDEIGREISGVILVELWLAIILAVSMCRTCSSKVCCNKKKIIKAQTSQTNSPV